MRITYIFFLIILSLILFSCSDKGINANNNNDSFFDPLPLKVGNRWKYDFIENNSETEEFNFSIINTVEKNNETVYIFNGGKYGFFDCEEFYKRNGLLYGIEDDQTPVEKTVMIFPKNPNIGDEWKIDRKILKLISKEEKIEIELGTYTCYKIKATMSDGRYYYIYWSDGNGIITMTDANENIFLKLTFIQIN